MSEGTKNGGGTEYCVLGFVADWRKGWLVSVSPGLSGCSSGKVSGLQVDLDFSNSSSACPFLLVDS